MTPTGASACPGHTIRWRGDDDGIGAAEPQRRQEHAMGTMTWADVMANPLLKNLPF